MLEQAALKVDNLDVHYKDFQAIWNVSLRVGHGEIVSIIGANGAGKSTLLGAVAGLYAPTRGVVELFGERIDGKSSHDIVPRGLSLVPEGRRVFPRLSVYENLVMGSYIPAARSRQREIMAKVHDLFPILKERHNQAANTLSGGEQQMLAIGRALMSQPKLILCDEISLGLAPVVIKDIYRQMKQINQEGITIVLVEQDVKRSLKAADRVYIMLEGKFVLEGKPVDMTEEDVRKAYFGI